MKKIIISLVSGAAMLATATSTFGQGQVSFQNTASINPVVFGAGVPIDAPTPGAPVWNSVPNTYTYGLYVGNSTATSLSQMTLIDTVGQPTVSFVAGAISGGPVTGFGNVGVANGFGGLVAGTTYDFFVVGWKTADGNNFFSATELDNFGGGSALGSVTPTLVGGSAGPTQLFGTGAGQVGGFALGFLVPEPSTLVLGGLGAAALLAFRRSK